MDHRVCFLRPCKPYFSLALVSFSLAFVTLEAGTRVVKLIHFRAGRWRRREKGRWEVWSERLSY